MFGFLRHLTGRVDYQTPIAEPSRDDLGIIPGLSNPADVAIREQRIEALDREALRALRRGDIAAMDGWLDRRNGVRPPRAPAHVPVIPGRSS